MNRKQRRAIQAMKDQGGFTAVDLPETTTEAREDLQKEYITACARLGEITYKMAVVADEYSQLEEAAEPLRNQLRDLNVKVSRMPKAPPAPEASPATEESK